MYFTLANALLVKAPGIQNRDSCIENVVLKNVYRETRVGNRVLRNAYQESRVENYVLSNPARFVSRIACRESCIENVFCES